MKTRKTTGLTLLEVIIASLILMLIVLMVTGVLSSASTTATRSSITGHLEARGRQFVDGCKTEFLSAQFTGSITCGGNVCPMGIAGNNTEIRYRVPIGRDASGVVKVGCFSPLSVPNNGPKAGWAYIIRFEADTVLKESVASPNASQPISTSSPPLPGYPPLVEQRILNMDVNGNGNRTQTFVRGKIKKYIVAPDGDPILGVKANPIGVEGLSDDAILMVSPSGTFNGDVDGTPNSGKLFRFVDEAGLETTPYTSVGANGRGIVFIVWHGAFDELAKSFFIRKSGEQAAFRNPQQ
jgi:hypothetical protein